MTYGVKPRGYRLPEASRLGAVHLQVSDLSRSLDYYQETLGLTVRDRRAGEAALAAGESAPPLLHLHERPLARRAPRRGERLGLYHFALLVPDRAALGRVIGHLAGAGMAVASADHAVSEAIYLWDPDGLGIEIYADRPRDAWRVLDGELYMTSAPLDVRSLLQAAGDERFTGLPPATVVGHMHLHVGDLEEGERWYHDGLGFDKVVWSYPGALFLSAGGYHHHLGINTWAGHAPPRDDDEPGLREWELCLPTLADLDAAAEHLTQLGRAVSRAGQDLVVRDPWRTQLRMTLASGPA